MSDFNTFDARWTLLFGVPAIAALSVLAVRRARAVARRIREVREEMARSPQNPYQALSELMAEKETPSKQAPKGSGRKTWPKD